MAIVIALFVASCGLDTEGLGEPDEGTLPEASDDTEPDIGPDEIVADVPGEDAAEEDSGHDEATPEETTEDTVDSTEDAEPEDADDAEDVVDDAADEGSEADAEDAGTEDGDAEDGAIDPCALPEIPTTGIFIFYCFDYDLLSPFALEFQIEQGGLPVVSWRGSPECTFTSRSRRFECTLTPLVWDATYVWNIRLDPGVGIGWSCGPELLEIWGTPRAWLNGVELAVDPVTNGDGGCNHSFTTPPPP